MQNALFFLRHARDIVPAMIEKFTAEPLGSDSVRREIQKKAGLARLSETGIDPEAYREYFEIFRKSDLPLKQALPDPHLVEEGILSAEELKEMWDAVKDRYEAIGSEEQTEETGKSIIEKMKPLAYRYTKLLGDYADDPAWKEGRTVSPPEELRTVRREMLALADEFNNLPAYLSYRFYGMYEFDPNEVSEDEYFRNEYH